MAHRYDNFRIDGPQITPQGFLKADAYPTRAGIFNYMMMDGSIRRELRHPDQVFEKESLKTLSEIPVTNDHPDEPVTADNARKYAVGFTAPEVTKDGDLMKTKVTIFDAQTIRDITGGTKQEMSCGYDCDVEIAAGSWNGLSYDAVQKNIRYNHLAVVSRGRAGPQARIKLDSEDAVMVDELDAQKNSGANAGSALDSKKVSTEDKIMPAKIKIDSVEFEVSETAAQAMSAKLDALGKSVEAVAAREKEIEALKGKLDAAEAEMKKRDEKIKELEGAKLSDKEILSRADALNKVREFGKKTLGKDFKDDMEVSSVKKAVVAKLMPEVKVEEKGDAYIDGAFDMLAEKAKGSAGKTVEDQIRDRADRGGSAADASAAREKQRQDGKEAWKNYGQPKQTH